MVLHLKRFHVTATSLPLPLHVMTQLRRGHLLRLLSRDKHLIRDNRKRYVLAFASLQGLVHGLEMAFGIVIQMPILERVVINTVGGDTLHERLAFELLDRTTISDIGPPLKRLNIKHRTGLNLQLQVTRMIRRKALDILVRKAQHTLRTARYNPSAQHHTQHEQQQRRHAIRHHQTMVTHARSHHRNDLRIAGQLGGEIDHGNEDEQRTEHIHIIRNKRQVVVEQYLT